ncbi:CPBP family intramembrane glutamic endopeptidase [Aeoliella sp. SH292]|uniref:CPBP family intramembrane glutamic endopeptidase n=1 Tax=Aeoliella sp. SH292 TaxID=3454464 RepID=UPI003F9BDB4F
MTEHGARLALLVCLSSTGFCIWGIIRVWQGQVNIPYRQREQAPWGFLMGLLPSIAIATLPWGFKWFIQEYFLQKPVASRHLSMGAPRKPSAMATNDLMALLSAEATIMLLIAVIMVLLIRFRVRSLPTALGLPRSISALMDDLKLGGFTALAAVAPAIGAQLLIYVVSDGKQQPVMEAIKEFLNNRSMLLLIFASIMAAAVVEEISFRVLLQGWLERMASLWQRQTRLLLVTPGGNSNRRKIVDVAPWVRGAVAVFLTSIAFAAAHLSQSFIPAGIFVFSLFLGYLYCRTHSLVAAIFAHALFNAINFGFAIAAFS